MATVCEGHILTRDYEYVCASIEGADAFTLFANIVSETKDTVTISRAMKWGKLQMKDITLSREDFELLYNRLDDWNNDIKTANNGIATFSVGEW